MTRAIVILTALLLLACVSGGVQTLLGGMDAVLGASIERKGTQ